MVERRRGDVRGADGTRVAFHSHGHAQSNDVVVLTNGIGTTENFWRYLVGDLIRDHRVVHWDYRGHGSSEVAASGDYRLQTAADDLARVTREVVAAGAPPPVHIGFSMGVAVVLELYRAHPELVRGLVLIAGAPDAPGTGTALFALPGSFAALRGLVAAAAPVVPVLAPGIRALLRSGLLDPLARSLGVLQPQAPKADIDQFLDGIAGMDPVAYWSTLRALLDADASDVLPGVQVPVSIVAAKQDTLMPASQVRRMREALPTADFVEIDRAGHAGLIEQGPKMVQAVRGLLEKVGRQAP